MIKTKNNIREGGKRARCIMLIMMTGYVTSAYKPAPSPLWCYTYRLRDWGRPQTTSRGGLSPPGLSPAFRKMLVLHIRRADSGAGLSPLSDVCVTGVLVWFFDNPSDHVNNFLHNIKPKKVWNRDVSEPEICQNEWKLATLNCGWGSGVRYLQYMGDLFEGWGWIYTSTSLFVIDLPLFISPRDQKQNG